MHRGEKILEWTRTLECRSSFSSSPSRAPSSARPRLPASAERFRFSTPADIVRRFHRDSQSMRRGGRVRFKAPVLKTGDGQPSGGSNPSPSATQPSQESLLASLSDRGGRATLQSPQFLFPGFETARRVGSDGGALSGHRPRRKGKISEGVGCARSTPRPSAGKFHQVPAVEGRTTLTRREGRPRPR